MTKQTVYKTLTELQHLRTRSSMYTGSTKSLEQERFIIDENGKMVKKTTKYNIGLSTLFKECIDNCIDNTKRDPPTTLIDVTITGNTINVKNNGKHIPIYQGDDIVSEIVFGKFRSGE